MDDNTNIPISAVRIRQVLDEYFSASELKDIIFELNVEYENLEGETKGAKARALVQYLQRRGRLAEVVQVANEHRSDISWTGEARSREVLVPKPRETKPDSPTPVFQHRDHFSRYEAGITKLLARLGSEHRRYADALVYQQRLTENITQARRFGDEPERRADRAEIIDQLNNLSRMELGISFNELSRD
jgi:hypothetical protein